MIRVGEPLSQTTQIDPSVPPPSATGEPLGDLAPRYFNAVASGGSTGRPKLIVDHNEGCMTPGLEGLIDLLGIPRDGVLINPGPLYHNAPFLFSSLALICGSQVVGLNHFDPEETLRLIERHRGQFICLVPTMMQRIIALPVRAQYDLSSLKVIWHMAAACPPGSSVPGPPTCGAAAAVLVSPAFAAKYGLNAGVEIVAQALTTDPSGVSKAGP